MAKQKQIDIDKLPSNFPTQNHSREFWEALGRVVANYGFLEEVLGKSIFSFTGAQYHPKDKIKEAFEEWIKTLEKALSESLANLIKLSEETARKYKNYGGKNIDELIANLKKSAKYRNVLCHGSWQAPDENNCSKPFFVTNEKDKLIWDTPINIEWLNQVQKHIAQLACCIINSVQSAGLNYPGLGFASSNK